MVGVLWVYIIDNGGGREGNAERKREDGIMWRGLILRKISYFGMHHKEKFPSRKLNEFAKLLHYSLNRQREGETERRVEKEKERKRRERDRERERDRDRDRQRDRETEGRQVRHNIW